MGDRTNGDCQGHGCNLCAFVEAPMSLATRIIDMTDQLCDLSEDQPCMGTMPVKACATAFCVETNAISAKAVTEPTLMVNSELRLHGVDNMENVQCHFQSLPAKLRQSDLAAQSACSRDVCCNPSRDNSTVTMPCFCKLTWGGFGKAAVAESYDGRLEG